MYYLLERDGEYKIIFCSTDDPLYGRGSWSLVGGPYNTLAEADDRKGIKALSYKEIEALSSEEIRNLSSSALNELRSRMLRGPDEDREYTECSLFTCGCSWGQSSADDPGSFVLRPHCRIHGELARAILADEGRDSGYASIRLGGAKDNES